MTGAPATSGLILAVRDNEKRAAVVLRQLTVDEAKDVGKTFAGVRRQYPPPQHDVVIGAADDLETFLQVYPRYRMAGAPQPEGANRART